jgi:predicted TIM-barrel fold metal-dependent hydrolase
VIPHLGADQWREFFALCRSSPNLYLDTTMALSGYLSEDRPGRDDFIALADRLLFGTDFPNLPYPWARERDWLLGVGLPEYVLEGILRGNALRLVGSASAVPTRDIKLERR